MRRGRPNNSQRRRSRRNASMKGVSRATTTKLRRQRVMLPAERLARGRWASRSGLENLPQDSFLHLPHLTALTRAVFGVIVAEHVQRAVNRQARELGIQADGKLSRLPARLVEADVNVPN